MLSGDQDAQNAIYKLIQKKHTDKNKNISISDEKLKNDIRFAEFSKVVPTKQGVLGQEFEDFIKDNLVNENSDLMTYAARKLVGEKNLFKTVNAKAARLVAAGNELKPEANQKISDDAAVGLAVLDKAPFVTGSETNKLFKEFALQLQESKAKSKVKEDFYARLPEALEADRDAAGLGKSVGARVQGEEATPPVPGLFPGAPESTPESAVGLSPRKKPASKIETRLDAIAAEYPALDREKAATVLRAFPDADSRHVAAMSEDPEMFSQVARGNLAASEKAQLLKRATDAGAQQGLPGMERRR